MGKAVGGERERERLLKYTAARRERNWLNPTASQRKEAHEYTSWLAGRGASCDDEAYSDTHALFVTERRRESEKERLRRVELRRTEERHRLKRERVAAGLEPVGAQRLGRRTDPSSARQCKLAARQELAVQSAAAVAAAEAAVAAVKVGAAAGAAAAALLSPSTELPLWQPSKAQRTGITREMMEMMDLSSLRPRSFGL